MVIESKFEQHLSIKSSINISPYFIPKLHIYQLTIMVLDTKLDAEKEKISQDEFKKNISIIKDMFEELTNYVKGTPISKEILQSLHYNYAAVNSLNSDCPGAIHQLKEAKSLGMKDIIGEIEADQDKDFKNLDNCFSKEELKKQIGL